MDKILLVEDEDSIREMVALNLKMDGYTVDPVSSAEKALELYNSDRDSYVLMLIDIMLPGMSGVDLCQTVRREDEKIGVIMLTAKTQFILITHRRGTMEEADVLYGVTMQDEGISKLLELRSTEVAEKLGIDSK